MRELLKSKIHRAKITGTNPDYEGSILIDADLMEKADLWEFEKVLVSNISNAQRFETYAIKAENGSGKIEVQGAAAKLCNKGDLVIIMAFETTDKQIKPKKILVDEKNKFVKYA